MEVSERTIMFRIILFGFNLLSEESRYGIRSINFSVSSELTAVGASIDHQENLQACNRYSWRGWVCRGRGLRRWRLLLLRWWYRWWGWWWWWHSQCYIRSVSDEHREIFLRSSFVSSSRGLPQWNVLEYISFDSFTQLLLAQMETFIHGTLTRDSRTIILKTVGFIDEIYGFHRHNSRIVGFNVPYRDEQKAISSFCCILRGPGGERIVDVPGGTEFELQNKTGSWAGRTHTHTHTIIPTSSVLEFVVRKQWIMLIQMNCTEFNSRDLASLH